jgi:hypothetical protein
MDGNHALREWQTTLIPGIPPIDGQFQASRQRTSIEGFIFILLLVLLLMRLSSGVSLPLLAV